MWRRYKGIVLIAIVLGAGYCSYMLTRYNKIKADSKRRAAVVVHLREDEDTVSEIGYVFGMRDELFLRDDKQVNLVWFIKVPATGDRYSCQYQYGFPEFKAGDDVRIIRPKNVASDSGYGYVVGLHGTLNGKAASVWVNELDVLEMEQ